MKENKNLLLDFYLLIPYYNNLPGLIRSLESINYDPAGYALLIVDDGSKEALLKEDVAPAIPARLSAEIIRMPRNGGITKALNTGLQWIEERGGARFVARLDCGDTCSHNRFSLQVKFLEEHPEVDLVGSWCIFKNFLTNISYRYRTPTEHKKIMRGMYFRNIFIHPTVMWRAAVAAAAGGYPEEFPNAEDYGFFYEILNIGKGAVIPEDLVICEINPKGLSISFRKEQLKSRERAVRQYGKNGVFRLLGVLKLRILRMVPNNIILEIKKMAYGIKRTSVN